MTTLENGLQSVIFPDQNLHLVTKDFDEYNILLEIVRKDWIFNQNENAYQEPGTGRKYIFCLALSYTLINRGTTVVKFQAVNQPSFIFKIVTNCLSFAVHRSTK